MIRVVRGVGLRGTVRAVSARLWSESTAFGLATDLTDLPEPRPAKIPVAMEVTDPRSFGGFEEEVERTTGPDRIEVEQRRRLCREGASRLFVATADDGAPIYAQWLFSAGGQAPLHRVTPNQFPDLTGRETLLEGAYTFVDYRKLGAMAVGLNQVMKAARDGGSDRCITYVSDDNIPSLRGCANVGFRLDHARVTRQRLGRRRVKFRSPTAQERAAWDAAVAPRPSA